MSCAGQRWPHLCAAKPVALTLHRRGPRRLRQPCNPLAPQAKSSSSGSEANWQPPRLSRTDWTKITRPSWLRSAASTPRCVPNWPTPPTHARQLSSRLNCTSERSRRQRSGWPCSPTGWRPVTSLMHLVTSLMHHPHNPNAPNHTMPHFTNASHTQCRTSPSNPLHVASDNTPLNTS
jgi:hypothetical protein